MQINLSNEAMQTLDPELRLSFLNSLNPCNHDHGSHRKQAMQIEERVSNDNIFTNDTIGTLEQYDVYCQL